MFNYIEAEVVPEVEFAGDHGAADIGVCGDFLVGALDSSSFFHRATSWSQWRLILPPFL